jgi:hypothetical protein
VKIAKPQASKLANLARNIPLKKFKNLFDRGGFFRTMRTLFCNVREGFPSGEVGFPIRRTVVPNTTVTPLSCTDSPLETWA